MREFTSRLIRQTDIVMKNIDYSLAAATDEVMEKELNGYVMWKHFYHMLNSLDRIFAHSEVYRFPDFHEDKLNLLDHKSGKTLSRAILINYFKAIREKIGAYMDGMDDSKLLEEVMCQEMRITRFDLIIAQFRHVTWHLGYIHSCIKAETGSLPAYIGVNKDLYPGGKL